MTELMRRRRALMGAGEQLPPVPSGYITDGLVFFLDGKQLVTATKWTDIVGGNAFNLIDCNLTVNGVVFNGTSSHGEHNGFITTDWENETIEVVFNGVDNIKTKTIFSQPMIGATNVGIGLRFGDDVLARLATGQNGVSHNWFKARLTSPVNRISVAATMGITGGTACLNGAALSSFSSASYGKNETGITCLGCRKTTDPAVSYNFYQGTIHAIRIYSRTLTLAEIQANQATDLVYYNI